MFCDMLELLNPFLFCRDLGKLAKADKKDWCTFACAITSFALTLLGSAAAAAALGGAVAALVYGLVPLALTCCIMSLFLLVFYAGFNAATHFLIVTSRGGPFALLVEGMKAGAEAMAVGAEVMNVNAKEN